MYNLGVFAVFTIFSILLSVNWLHGTAAGLYIVVLRIGQGIGGSFLFANSTATPSLMPSLRPRGGMALGINNIMAVSGMFIGLVVGGQLAPIDWRLASIVSAPFGVVGTAWAYLKLKDNGVRTPARIDWWGNVLFAVGLTSILVGITYGIEPYQGSAMGVGQPQGDRRTRGRGGAAGGVHGRGALRRPADVAAGAVPDPRLRVGYPPGAARGDRAWWF